MKTRRLTIPNINISQTASKQMLFSLITLIKCTSVNTYEQLN